MIARWPGTIKGGTKSDLQTTQWDLMPTLADAGGKAITKEMDGISIMPTLRGHADKQSQREYLYFEFYEVSQQQSVRIGDWKGYRTGGWDGKIELYDLSKDIGETKDLASAHPELVEKIKGIMKKEHSPHPYWNLNPTNNGVRKPRKKKK